MEMILLFLLIAPAFGKWSKLMEGEYYQGDMILTPEQIRSYQFNEYGSSKFKRWPKVGKYVKIKYTIDRSIDDPYLRKVLAEAIGDYEKNTCLRFEEDKTHGITLNPHIRFVSGPGCAAPVGRNLETTFNGRYVGNKIMLHNSDDSSCWHKGIIMHEMGHTIGFFHEQSRPDRNKYVEILYDNIKKIHGKDMSFNFRIERMIDSMGHPYDYLSMMHYGQHAFGDDKVTIRTLDPKYQDIIGQRDGFSEEDISQINDLYEC